MKENINASGLLIAIALTALLSSILIWLVGQLGLGLRVDGAQPALIAGITMALVGGVITFVVMALGLRVRNELLRAVANIVLGAAVILVCSQVVPGLSVSGFGGALVASLAIGVIAWVLSLIPRRVNHAASEKSR